ncbi:MAG: FtsH protease activity modulator HflK [Phycisphaerae bacterium]|nr:FtsH protease activity modulator HflK [Phycisphaerae bacterium]
MQERPPFDLSDFRPPNINPKTIRLVVIGVLALILLYTSIYTVEPEEVGVVLRFGKYVRTVDPGLNFIIPFWIESLTKVPVERQLKEEFGFRTVEPGVRTRYAGREYQEESLMLTGDLNAAEVEWIVQYRVADPYKFLFKVRNARQTFRDINEAIMRQIVGDRSVDEVLTIGRIEIANTVSEKVQELCDQYDTGIKVDQVVLQDVNPPDPVKPAFNEVNEAQQEREKLINQAKSEYNKVIPKARGDAQRIIEEAHGYSVKRVNEAKGDAAKFNSVFAEYSKAPEVTRQRIYLETMNDVLQKVGRKLITDEEATGILPLFQLGTEGGTQK